MERETKNFLVDLIHLIQEKYNKTVTYNDLVGDEKQFCQGSNFAYYDVLNIIESQLKAFGYEDDDIQSITPSLGKKLER